ncbi:multiple sugar transport system permease protein [Microbacterium sp. W4I4]|uniref:carbohydrate ABC transporter permease n=1 Tax=Microbacterium sp. W4I4 TaxID=3042295 RepID=UPI00277F4013|nr:sugar ABC transporter permease [Microbacterium sp. W4I4]MDQ0614486.1 multiple sugar transport system permease protein [Microbacterium sp. W4I4]
MTIEKALGSRARTPAPGPLLAPIPARRGQQRRRAARKASAIALMFLLPYLLLFLAFRIVPALGGIGLSLADYSLTGDITYVGGENFARLFADELFWNALRVTIIYSLIAVPLVVVVSLLMANLASRSIRGIKVYRSAFFLPVITSLVTTAVIWQWIYSSQGPLNWFLGLFGVPAVPWLASGFAVLPALAIVAMWSRFGYDMLILMAGMLDIPQDYYEAAGLDGANAWQKFRHITLPGLRRPLFFVVILEIVASFQVFDLIYVMTGGGPVTASYSLVYMIYDQGFGYFNFGYASAAGVVLLVITMVIAAVQRLYLKDED